MSLARFTLRMLATAALLPQPGDAHLITMAGDKVFPDGLDPLQFNLDAQDIPAIAIYTDDDDATLVNTSANGGPYHRMITLRVEITIGSFDTIERDGQTGLQYSLPETDAELEAKLDIFEMQVRWALSSQPRLATYAFRAYTIATMSISSHPTRDADNNKLASRRLTFHIRTPDDCPPIIGFDTPKTPSTQLDPQWLANARADKNPNSGKLVITEEMFPLTPWLAPMFVAMQNQPSYRPVLDRLAQTNVPSIILPVLKSIRGYVDAVSPQVDPQLLSNLLRTEGPDGRIEVETNTEIKQ